jgi:hypothetical protein
LELVLNVHDVEVEMPIFVMQHNKTENRESIALARQPATAVIPVMSDYKCLLSRLRGSLSVQQSQGFFASGKEN